jgi:hypothetical protein
VGTALPETVVPACHAAAMGAHPAWCARHTAARCRSEPAEVVYRCGALVVELGAGLEQWSGLGREPTCCLYLPEVTVRLPQEPAVQLGALWVGLLEQAGWVSPGDGVDLLAAQHRSTLRPFDVR